MPWHELWSVTGPVLVLYPRQALHLMEVAGEMLAFPGPERLDMAKAFM